MKYLQILIVSVAISLASARPRFIACNRSLDLSEVPNATCGGEVDVLACPTLMGETPVLSGDFLASALPSCISFNESFELSFSTGVNAIHISSGVLNNDVKCTAEESALLTSTNAFTSAQWTPTAESNDIIMLIAQAAGYGAVTFQEVTGIVVSNNCTSTSEPTTAPSTSPSASPSTSPSVSPSISPTNPGDNATTAPSTSPTSSPTSSPSTSPTGNPTASPVSSSVNGTSSPSTSPTSSPEDSTTVAPTVGLSKGTRNRIGVVGVVLGVLATGL